MPARPSSARRALRGVTLVEVMIALLVLSLGILGMIGLKAAGLRHVTQANSRAVAALHAAEMLDRLRANPVRAQAGQYALAMTDPAPVDPTGIVETDLAQWRARIVESLPGGSGSVLVQPDGLARVEIQWLDRAESGAQAEMATFAFEARL
jgi:type IV pilus assembly protein PilV